MHEIHEYEGRKWVVLLSSVVAAVLVAAAVFFAGRAIYRSARHTETKKPTTVQTQPAPAKVPAKTTQPPTSSLPNNGPGNTAAIFIISSIGAGGLHYGFKRRRGA